MRARRIGGDGRPTDRHRRSVDGRGRTVTNGPVRRRLLLRALTGPSVGSATGARPRRPEPHRHQRVCLHLELRRSYFGSRTAAALSSAAVECHTRGLQHHIRLRWRKSHRHNHSHRYRRRYRRSAHQRMSFRSVQHLQNGRRGLCLDHVNGSKLSERMRAHPQVGQLNGPTCNIISMCHFLSHVIFSWTHCILISARFREKNS